MSVKLSNAGGRALLSPHLRKYIAGATATVLALGALVGFAGPAWAFASITTTNPASGATGVSLSPEIILTFDAPVVNGSGFIVIKSGPDTVDEINVGTSPQVQPGGASSIKSIFPPTLTANTAYTIEIADGVFKSQADDTPVNGIIFSFTTGAAAEAPVIQAVTITGTPTVGELLTAVVEVTGSPEPTLSYQWEADQADIADATSSTFTLTSDQIGKPIRVRVTAQNSAGSGFLRSGSTPAVADAEVVGVAPAIETATITGTPTVGQVLTAGATGVTGSPEPTLTYQWQAGGVDISGATSSTFTLTSAQLPSVITVKVTATNTEGSSFAISSATAPVAGLVPTITTATIAGTPTVGQVLTAGSTGVTGTPEPTLTYQWKAGGTDIVGATSSTFTLTSAQLGAVITVVVTATNIEGSDVATSTGTTAVVAAAPVVSSPAPPSGGGAIVAPPVQAPVATPVVAPVRTPTEAFAANSATLTKELRVSIRKALAANPNAKAAICRGFVASGAASAADRKLARDRSTAVCNRITRVNPDLDVEVKKVLVASSSKQLRKVRMVLR
jgi:methionine-rich copper-binding protein CopC